MPVCLAALSYVAYILLFYFVMLGWVMLGWVGLCRSVGCIFAEMLGMMSECQADPRKRRPIFPGDRCARSLPPCISSIERV